MMMTYYDSKNVIKKKKWRKDGKMVERIKQTLFKNGEICKTIDLFK